MNMRIKKIIVAILVLALLYSGYYCWRSFPIATGYGAKALCSAVFVSGRQLKDVVDHDLSFFPLNYASYDIDYVDSSATCSMFGFAVHKAIYRRGLGATIVNDISEPELRAQRFILAPTADIKMDTVPWPQGDKINAGWPPGIDSAVVQKAVGDVFNRQNEHENFTRALIVLYKGQVVAENYAPGFTRSTKLVGWSMTKSITGTLAGLLAKSHKLDINQPAPIAAWGEAGDSRHGITIKHLLQQTSGLAFEEIYHRSSDANRMLFVIGNAAAYAASRPLDKKPGTDFYYSSGNSNLLSSIYRRMLGDSLYHRFPYDSLFHRIGMYNTVLEPDASGTFVGSSFCLATARDWARFGLLYCNGGTFNGERILPDKWIKQSVTPADATEKGEYGFQWWLNAGAKNNANDRLYPELPGDMFFADGYEGQNIFIIPSKQLVVVRLGLTRGKQWGENEFLKTILGGIN
jgi:hypothetical protein